MGGLAAMIAACAFPLGAALLAAGVNHELHLAPGAAHGFLNDTRPEVFHPEAAATSWARTLAFLAERR